MPGTEPLHHQRRHGGCRAFPGSDRHGDLLTLKAVVRSAWLVQAAGMSSTRARLAVRLADTLDDIELAKVLASIDDCDEVIGIDHAPDPGT